MKIKIRTLRSASVLKYVGGSYLMIFLLLALLSGGLAAMGFHTVRWNREAITGVWALPCAFFICTFLWLVTTILTWLSLVVGFPLFRLVYQLELEGEDTKDAS